jgi:hypothetical protein
MRERPRKWNKLKFEELEDRRVLAPVVWTVEQGGTVILTRRFKLASRGMRRMRRRRPLADTWHLFDRPRKMSLFFAWSTIPSFGTSMVAPGSGETSELTRASRI